LDWLIDPWIDLSMYVALVPVVEEGTGRGVGGWVAGGEEGGKWRWE